jgi:hypothetical protein
VHYILLKDGISVNELKQSRTILRYYPELPGGTEKKIVKIIIWDSWALGQQLNMELPDQTRMIPLQPGVWQQVKNVGGDVPES